MVVLVIVPAPELFNVSVEYAAAPPTIFPPAIVLEIVPTLALPGVVPSESMTVPLAPTVSDPAVSDPGIRTSVLPAASPPESVAVDLMTTAMMHPLSCDAKPVALAEKGEESRHAHITAFYDAITKGTPSPADITIGATAALTAILGRLAMDFRRPVSWQEMLASNGWPG